MKANPPWWTIGTWLLLAAILFWASRAVTSSESPTVRPTGSSTTSTAPVSGPTAAPSTATTQPILLTIAAQGHTPTPFPTTTPRPTEPPLDWYDPTTAVEGGIYRTPKEAPPATPRPAPVLPTATLPACPAEPGSVCQVRAASSPAGGPGSSGAQPTGT